GLGEKITAILFEGNVVTAENVIEQGIKGLSSLPGIGPKKATLILEFAEKINEKIIEKQREDESLAKTAEETQITETAEEQEEQQEEEQEIPIDQLREVSPSAIESLLKNGFETLAELSVTKKEELIEIDGIDLETATIIVEQAKKQLASDE
ncbi:MAG TPA: transcription termination/antitermination protein NusA, partial [Nitrospinaceae bacterium]|nr:transcription termination/antitermination protein NusA [Nitrospinaceae bacterium]